MESTADPKLGVVNVDSNLVEELEQANINVKQYEKATNETIVEENLDGLLKMEDESFELTLQNSDPSTAKSLQMKVNQADSITCSIKTNGKSCCTGRLFE